MLHCVVAFPCFHTFYASPTSLVGFVENFYFSFYSYIIFLHGCTHICVCHSCNALYDVVCYYFNYAYWYNLFYSYICLFLLNSLTGCAIVVGEANVDRCRDDENVYKVSCSQQMLTWLYGPVPLLIPVFFLPVDFAIHLTYTAPSLHLSLFCRIHFTTLVSVVFRPLE